MSEHVEKAEIPEEVTGDGKKMSGVYVTTGAGESENPPEPVEATVHDPTGPEISSHHFWNTQPVPQSEKELAETVEEVKPVQKIVPKRVSNENVPLPDEFYYTVIDVNEPEQLKELQKFLEMNYVEDNDGKFRFAYSCNQIKWWMTMPGSDQSLYSIGVRTKSDNELVGYINGVPGDYTVQTHTARFLVVDFLCLKSTLRSRGLAPILIQELTRHAYKNGIYSAIYTSGTNVTTPVAKPLYYHRMINVKKLVEIKFAVKPKYIPEKTYYSYYDLPKINSQILKTTFRPIVKRDHETCISMGNKFSERNFTIRNTWSKKIFAHLNDNIKNVVSTYVLTNGKTGAEEKILGWISWYFVHTAVLEESAPNNILTTGYVFYYAYDEKIPSFEYTESTELTKEQKEELELCEKENTNLQEELFTKAFYIMKEQKIDVCTCLDIMKNKPMIQKLKFEKGDAYLNYYLFNMKWAKDVKNEDIAVVLL